MVGPALHARDHVDRHLVDVLGQVADRIRAAGHTLVGGAPGGHRTVNDWVSVAFELSPA
jgi:hypothetical protein